MGKNLRDFFFFFYKTQRNIFYFFFLMYLQFIYITYKCNKMLHMCKIGFRCQRQAVGGGGERRIQLLLTSYFFLNSSVSF